jgi:hypothetical protein
MKKKPPIEKIYEAYSAIADNRVHLEDNRAAVTSSDGKKTYTVTWQGDCYSSDDSATYWQGYPGYPVIAVLMLQGKLPVNSETAKLFAGINWNELNRSFKRDYAKAVNEVFKQVTRNEAEQENITSEVAYIFELLTHLDISIKRGR